ncbi:MAG: hypothetical protein Kow0068_05380 [Marinilabiliales bacterium]
MCKSSEEGKLNGLGWIQTNVIKFNENKIKIPHMGWNEIIQKRRSKLLNFNEEINWRFYFAHSFHISNIDKTEVDAYCTCNYGNEFICLIEKKNIFGVQFHPEKSHKFGFKLLNNFLNI